MAGNASAKTHVAVLGGGMAALSAAFELSHPRHQGRYQITLYQLGWRLGGKCASGRDRDQACRIQEHGPHVFFGFYDNAFEMLRACYQELARPAGQGFQTIEEALEGQNSFVVMEDHGGWKPWSLTLPDMPGEPGTDDHPSTWQILWRVFEWLEDEYERGTQLIEEARSTQHGLQEAPAGFVGAVPDTSPLPNAAQEPFPKLRIRDALAFARELDPFGRDHSAADYQHLGGIIEEIRTWFWERWEETFDVLDDLRRFFLLMDLGATILIGALFDGLFFPTQATLRRVNQKDYRTWLKDHGARQATIDCALVRGPYDTVFAYPDGDINQAGNVEAGSSVHAQLQMMGYRSHILWKMRAGTGDITAAPLYQLLRRRGVEFRFFHRVDRLEPSADHKSIAKVSIGRQVRVKQEPYEPLFPCKGMPCWPSEPLFDQIVEGDQLKAECIDLENYWTKWQDTGGTLELTRGADFDLLVLGISKEALCSICQPLRQVDPKWAAMLDGLATVQTQNVQLWLSAASGWEGPPQPVLTAYDASPLDTWLDASEVVPYECWRDGEAKHMAMLCGPMKTPRTLPPRSDGGYPDSCKKAVREAALAFLARQAEALWPKLSPNGSFDWKALVAAANAKGESRLGGQYFRPCINPSDRYVQSLVDTGRLRLRPDQSGFDNLVLTGDWTDNGMNLGSFEATVISGRLAARAISGEPKTIHRLPASYFEDDGRELS